MKKILFLLCLAQFAFGQSVQLVSSGNGTCSNPAGHVVISVTGGTAPYTVNIANSTCAVNTNTVFASSTFTISNLSPCSSNYIFTVYDNANTNMGWVMAGISNPMTATVVPHVPSCSGACNGSVTVNVTGGTAPYTYNWSNMVTTQQVTGLCAGSYTVTVASADGCSTLASANLVNPPAFTATATALNPSCNGACNGTVVVSASSGVPPYSYTWTPSNATIPEIDNVCAGSYTIAVMDSHGCLATAVAAVTNPPAITATITSSNPSCAGACNGSVSVVASNGNAPYTYSWTPPGTGPSLSNVCAGGYSVVVTDANGCVRASTVMLTAAPLPISVSPNQTTVCAGSSASYTAMGAASYTWNTGSTSSVLSVVTGANTIYTVTGSDNNGCIGTQTVEATVDNTCALVWPGDANSDGNADNTDILELGLNMGLTGPSRVSQGNTWAAFFATSWAGNTSTGSNLVHSDCNGDGLIDQNDTLAVYTNYGLSHAFKNQSIHTGSADVTITPNQSTLLPGTWGTASVLLGDASNSQTLHGLAFTVSYDNSLLQQDSVYLQYTSSFMDPGAHNLTFRKRDFANGALYCASTQTTAVNASGNGQIATLHYKLKQSLSTNATLHLGISNVTKMLANGQASPLTAGTGTVSVTPIATGIDMNAQAAIAVYPNPANTQLNIASEKMIGRLELTDIAGRIIYSQAQLSTNAATIDLSPFQAGAYYLSVYSHAGDLLKKEKIMVIQ